jgi:hypothetical protein
MLRPDQKTQNIYVVWTHLREERKEDMATAILGLRWKSRSCTYIEVLRRFHIFIVLTEEGEKTWLAAGSILDRTEADIAFREWILDRREEGAHAGTIVAFQEETQTSPFLKWFWTEEKKKSMRVLELILERREEAAHMRSSELLWEGREEAAHGRGFLCFYKADKTDMYVQCLYLREEAAHEWSL